MSARTRQIPTGQSYFWIFPVFSSPTKKAGLWIRICMFLGLQDPDPSLFVRIRILPSSSKNKRKPWFLPFCDFFMTFYLKAAVNVPSKSKKQKILRTERAGSCSGSGSVTQLYGSADTRIQIRIYTKMSRIHNSRKYTYVRCSIDTFSRGWRIRLPVCNRGLAVHSIF